ncbi:uncharacterized protein [Macrobrachium rosenbergii]|uniref:uncharacterized protein isoform X4 n=1 Tax=Macrobrachium rosenbergii TaxID=79674 RepID=UPI0034D7AFB6
MNRKTKLAPFLLVMVAAAQAQQAGSSGNTCPDSCPDFVRPVCGTNNLAYRNECHLQVAACNSNIRKRNDGPCVAAESRDCDRSCPTSYQPFCATNGVTYDNRCKLAIATCLDANIKERYEGVCPIQYSAAESANSGSSGGARPSIQTSSNGARPSVGQAVRPVVQTLSDSSRPASAPASVVNTQQPPRNCEDNCTPGFRPVCGTDNQVYGNDCLLRVAICKNPRLGKLNDGVCTGFRNPECSAQNCERIANPVCGSDGRTYENMCVLRNRACVDNSLLRLHDGPCSAQRCGEACPAIADPVCGSDGITYPNHCILINEACRARSNVVKAFDGACRSDRG